MCLHIAVINNTYVDFWIDVHVNSLQDLLNGENSSDIEAVLSLFGHLASQVRTY